MTHSTFAITRKTLAFLLVASALLVTALPANAQTGTNIARNKTATASSIEGQALNAAKAVDGSTSSRWASSQADANWITIDLGAAHTISRVILRWEEAYASGYQIQTSTNGSTWTTIYSTTTGKGGAETINVSGTGRYVRMNATKRGTSWGYSLWEFEIYGTPATSSSSSVSSAINNTANLAFNKPTTASTSETATLGAVKATDGNTKSRWASKKTDSEWIAIDLGSNHAISRVNLRWEAAYAREYHIQVSNNGSNWSTIFNERNGNGGVDDITLNGTGRYVRILGIKRATQWGYSLWEVEVYGSPSGTTSSSSSSVSSSSVSSVSSSSSSSSSSVSSSSSSSSSVDSSAPTVPGSTKATGFESRIEVSWTPSIDNLGVTGYQVYRNNTKVADLSSAVSGYIDTNVVKDVTYSYSIRARDAAANWSAKSTAASAKLLTAGELTLTWSNPTSRENGQYLELDEIGGYEIRYKKATDSVYTTVVINNNHTNNYSMSQTSGSYVYEIATFDSTGLYSTFVAIQPK
jgi:hypothetical protein